MYPWSHFIFAYLIGLTVSKIGLLTYNEALIIGVLAVLIDLDHYIGFIKDMRFKDLKLKDAWNNSSYYHKFQERTFIHHRVGIMIITMLVLILILFQQNLLVLIISIAYYSHLLLDYVHVSIMNTKTLKIKEEGFIVNVTYGEIIFDIVVVGLIMVLIII